MMKPQHSNGNSRSACATIWSKVALRMVTDFMEIFGVRKLFHIRRIETPAREKLIRSAAVPQRCPAHAGRNDAALLARGAPAL